MGAIGATKRPGGETACAAKRRTRGGADEPHGSVAGENGANCDVGVLAGKNGGMGRHVPQSAERDIRGIRAGEQGEAGGKSWRENT